MKLQLGCFDVYIYISMQRNIELTHKLKSTSSTVSEIWVGMKCNAYRKQLLKYHDLCVIYMALNHHLQVPSVFPALPR